MQVNSMEDNSNHFLSSCLGYHNFDEKIDSENILVESIADSLETPPGSTNGKSLAECPVCSAKFTQRNNLSRHMQRFHGVKPRRSHLVTTFDPFSPHCSECSLKFTRKSNLLRHMKKFHEYLAPSKGPELPKIFSCPECDTKFTQWKNCQRHMRNLHSARISHEEEVKDEPTLKSGSNSTLEDNMEYVIEVDPFPVISPLRVETISSEPTNSPEYMSRSENQLPDSSSNPKSAPTLKKSSKVECIECGVLFSSQFNLKRHKRRFHRGKDDILGVVEEVREVKTTMAKELLADFPDPKLLLRTCPECHVLFSSASNLKRHIKRAHTELDYMAAVVDSTSKEEGDSNKKRLFCTLCPESGVSFSTSSNLRRHMKRAHSQQEIENVAALSVAHKTTDAGDSGKNRLSCPLCDEGCVTFSTPSNLRRHMRRSHQQEEDSITEIEDPIIDTAEIMKCPRCDYRENRLNLYVHFNLVHGLQVIIEYQVFDSETQLDEWLSQISPEAQFVVRKSDSNRMVISCSQPNGPDEFCPAEMIILTESDKCTVHYVKTHVHET